MSDGLTELQRLKNLTAMNDRLLYEKVCARTKKDLEYLRKKMNATNVVCGVGPMITELVIVGEAPGAEEDQQDMPFVGRAGSMLDLLLEESDIDRSKIYLTNTVKCRPTVNNLGKKNRPPTFDEIQTCKGALWKELQLIQPKIIIALGSISSCLLLKLDQKKIKFGKLVQQPQFVSYLDTVVYPTWHPSFLLRSDKKYTLLSLSFFASIATKVSL